MLRKLILTVALAALYKGEPPQLGGSLFTIFCFLLGHLLLKPYLNQGLNVFQRTSVSPCLCGFPLQLPLSADCTFFARTRCPCDSLALRLRGTGLALVSQFLTVFGSLMFVVQEAVAKNNAATEDLNGKRMVSFLIIFANAAAGGLYPVYRFVNAWAESGDIDLNFIANCVKSGAEKCLGPEAVASLLASCACLSKAKEKADEAEVEVRRLRATADEMHQHERVSTAEGRYNDAAEAKKHIDEARALHQDVKSGVADVRSAAADPCAEADTARASSDGHTIAEDHNSEIQEVGGAPVNANRAARGADLLFHQHPGGFSPAGMSRHDLDARPTPFRASDQLPPIVFESIHGLSSDVVFRQPLHQYLNEVRQDEAASRSKTETDDSALVQALVCHEEEPAPRTRTNGPVLFLS